MKSNEKRDSNTTDLLCFMQEQAQLLQHIFEMNCNVLDQIQKDEFNQLQARITEIQEYEYKISKNDFMIKKYLENNDGFLFNKELTLINKLAEQNRTKLIEIQKVLDEQLKSSARSLQQTRTGSKMIKAIPKMHKENSTFEFNV